MTTFVYLFLFACFGSCLSANNPDAWYAHESRLRDDLLKDYDVRVPPLEKETDNVTVTLGVSIVSLDNLDEKTEVLSTHIYFRVSWKDVRLQWDKDDYNGLTTVAMPHNLIWRPDITPYNSITADHTVSLEYLALVSMDGSVLFIPKVALQTACTVDLTYFPFDKQECEMKFGSWVYSSQVVVIDSGYLDISLLTNSTKWNVWDAGSEVVATKYACCPEKYFSFVARIGLERITESTLNLYMGPAVCFGLLIPAVFLLPALSSNKIVLGTGLLVSQVLMLEMLVEILPPSHATVPTLGLYFLANIIMLSLSLALSAVIINVWDRSRRTGAGVPVIIDRLFNGCLGRVLCVKREDYMDAPEPKLQFVAEGDSFDGSRMDDGAVMVKDHNSSSVQAGWRQLSVVLDRLLLGVLFIIWIFITASLLHFKIPKNEKED